MKKLLLSLLAVAVCVGTSFAAPQPKVKTVKIADNAVFEGVTLKNKPLGKGTLTLGFCGTLSGEFNNLEVSNGKLILKEHKRVITGDFSMSIYKEVKEQPQSSDLALIKLIKAASKYKFLEITIKNGKFNNRPIVGEATMKYENGAYVIVLKSAYSPKLSSEFMGIIKQFVGDKVSYKITDVDGVAQYRIDNKNIKRQILQDATTVTLNFKNGAVAKINLQNSSYTLTRPNGDFVSVASDGIKGYKITGGNSVIEAGKVTHTFENGNKYIGTVNGEAIVPYTKVTSFNELLSFTGLTWAWADFKKHAGNGTLIYADGKSEKVIAGITETERKAWETEMNALRKNDTFVADANGNITSCTISYRDGVVFHYSKADDVCEYVYKNGEKLKLSGGYFEKETYNNMLATLIAPDLYSWDVSGERVFDNGKLSINLRDGEIHSVKFAKDSKGNFVEYGWSRTKVLKGMICKYTFTNHPKYKSMDTSTYGSSTVVLKNGNTFCGNILVKYDENAKCSLNDNAYIKKFGITIKAAPSMISDISFIDGELQNSSGKLIAIYANGRENKEELKNAQLKQKIKQLKEKNPEWGWYISGEHCMYYVGEFPTKFVLNWGTGTPIGLIKAIWGNQSLRLVWTKTVGGVKEEKYRFYVGDGAYDVMMLFSNGRLKKIY